VNAGAVASDVLLALGVAVELVCVAGLVRMRDPLSRLHYASAASTLGAPPIAAAVMVREWFTSAAVNALVVGVALVVLGPALAHATARAFARPAGGGERR
jgi:multicomponent Na+:H+ antiporter subunit G